MLIYFFTIFIAALFSLFSTAVISYVAMATPIGPWMEMTLVLVGTIIFRMLARYISVATRMRSLAVATASGGIGGAVAMACAFSFPTLYFLDPVLFNSWLAHPFYFAAVLGVFVMGAGSFGLFIARYFEDNLLADDAMIFPIGQMVYNMIAIQNRLKKAAQLACGVGSALIYGVIQTFTALVPAMVTVLPAVNMGIFQIPHIMARTDLIPMFWAIGFTTGHVIALPLLVAVIAKFFLIDPVHVLFFQQLSHLDYILAFGAGMAIQGAFMGLIDVPHILQLTIKKIIGFAWLDIHLIRNTKKEAQRHIILLGLLVILIAFFSYFSFSLGAQLYLLVFTVICINQLLIIAGKIGIAPLGRFATFVMIPGLVLFGMNAIQVTLLATFVEIAGVVAVDMMFGQKVAQLASIKRSTMFRYQWFGLIVSAVSIGSIFWLLITQYGLGSPELIATRAQSRALLIQAFNFDYIVMILGFVFSYCLKFIGINATLVFGGLLMGLDTSLMLIAGGLSTYLVKNKEEHYPFWSGVYATNSLWAFTRMFF